jgi:hypothetical protein
MGRLHCFLTIRMLGRCCLVRLHLVETGQLCLEVLAGPGWMEHLQMYVPDRGISFPTLNDHWASCNLGRLPLLEPWGVCLNPDGFPAKTGSLIWSSAGTGQLWRCLILLWFVPRVCTLCQGNVVEPRLETACLNVERTQQLLSPTECACCCAVSFV